MFGWKLSLRYFLGRRISILAVASVALCVFIVVVVMSVMNGLVAEFKEKNHRFVGDCVIRAQSLTGFPYADEFVKQLDSQAFVAAVSETVSGAGLMTTPGDAYNTGIEYMGLDPENHCRVTNFAQTLRYHRDNPSKAFEPSYAPHLEGCVLGVDLIVARRPDTGEYDEPDSAWMQRRIISSFPLTPKGGLARAGVDMVSAKTFYYSDRSHSGLVIPDGRMVYLPLPQARILSGMDSPILRSSAIHIRFREDVSTESGTEKVRTLWREFVKSYQDKPYSEMLASVRVMSWKQDRREYIAPMEKEQILLMFLFLMLGVVTVFIIFVVFYMIIGHKTKDLGVLKSVGMPGASVAAVFLWFAAIVGVIGSFIGTTAGCLFLWKINDFENWLYNHYGWRVWDRQIYAIDRIPNEIGIWFLIVVASCAVAACLLGAIVPSVQAARKDAVRVLQVSQV